ncbi:MAG: type IA DNA topoisomerase [Lachnospiraceae bacterium]|nr:type IA DNA topoisomerase [Lachnospiraceae bacterium]
MGKSLFIAEKPSVARQFADVLHEGNMKNRDGYIEGDNIVVTWCVGHLVSMSYPEVYDEKYKKWRLDTLPFIPKEFKYEVIKSAAKQYKVVSSLLNREDVDRIYVCTDSGREGEYIYRLVRQMAGVHDKEERRVWIDSQTEEEIKRGIKEAKELSFYDNLSDSAYLRAKEDYLMGINFSRLLTLLYGREMAGFLNEKYVVISVGRVMTCVLGMVVRREREIREFVKTPFFRVFGNTKIKETPLSLEWKAVSGSEYFESPLLYKENGFKEEKDAKALIDKLSATDKKATIVKVEKKKEKKNPPLLYNLAEIQNDCSKFFKISPDETLKIIQELYEKKLVTYPRTDARVLSTAVAKEIDKNIKGLLNIPGVSNIAKHILDNGLYKGLEKTRYVNDKQITDHYAIIPTGQGLRNLGGNALNTKVYELIVRRFLAIFLPAAEYEKISLEAEINKEHFFATSKYLKEPGYQAAMEYSFKKDAPKESEEKDEKEEKEDNLIPKDIAESLKKGDILDFDSFEIKEGETSPPKRYNSGSIILAMENAGKLIEDEELREQIKSSGIGTSATRAEILNKLIRNKYLNLNKKTQIITPTLQGEIIYDIVGASIPSLLNAELTASWEKGLNMVTEGSITSDEYMVKLNNFIIQKTDKVMKSGRNTSGLKAMFIRDAGFYKDNKKQEKKK